MVRAAELKKAAEKEKMFKGIQSTVLGGAFGSVS